MKMIKYLKNLINGRRQQCNIPVVSGSYYYNMIQEREKDKAIILQKFENKKIEDGIKNEAQRMLNEYNNAPTMRIGDNEFKNCLHVMRPFISGIIIYDVGTAKYKDSNIQELVSEEYERIRSLNCH